MSERIEPTRTPVIAGNWKMNKTPDEATSFFRDFLHEYAPDTARTVIFFPPALSLAAAREALAARPDIELGVQNVHWEKNGAFTGEIAASMAAAAGAHYTLVGHSERRQLFGETDEEVGRKVAAALAAGLAVVACIGETLEQRQGGELRAVLLRQLDAVLDAVPFDAVGRLLIAYEPVWAIGTGVNATPVDAAEAHGIIRDRCAERLGASVAAVPILYGGSVKPDNVRELLEADGVDGVLVGGASLDAAGFAAIARG